MLAACEAGGGQIEADTIVSRQSWSVALLGAGATTDATRRVLEGEDKVAFCAVRPPGHHALPNGAMGFCLFNNVAVAAKQLRARGYERVAIVDFDLHHGNGTEAIFYDDPSVLYASLHQYPYYPGTGDASEIGVGAGVGATVNVPMPAGCGDAEYVGVMQRVFAPVARTFAPDMILVSCGFDAHADDPSTLVERNTLQCDHGAAHGHNGRSRPDCPGGPAGRAPGSRCRIEWGRPGTDNGIRDPPSGGVRRR